MVLERRGCFACLLLPHTYGASRDSVAHAWSSTRVLPLTSRSTKATFASSTVTASTRNAKLQLTTSFNAGEIGAAAILTASPAIASDTL
jgi:hypothetical protein